MGRQTFPKNRHWRCRRDVQRQSIPQTSSSDRKSSIADGWKTGASDDKHISTSYCGTKKPTPQTSSVFHEKPLRYAASGHGLHLRSL